MASNSQQSSSELYNLRWNSFFTNMTSVFSEHQSNETLTDVTLSCEGQFIKAHRLVLSASSAYFQKMFQAHAAPNILVVLSDIRFADLQLAVQFMYKGEVKVHDAEMQKFLALGRLLAIKGLCNVELKKKTDEDALKKSAIGSLTPRRESTDNGSTKGVNIKDRPPIVKENETIKETPPKKRKLVKTPEPLNFLDLIEPKIEPTPLEIDTQKDEAPPMHIPRPPNAFMIFANQWRKKLAVEYPDECNKDISVRLGNMWKSLSSDTKDGFYDDARKADDDHKLKYPGYAYNPREARNRKAILAIQKLGQKMNEIDNYDELEEIVSKQKQKLNSTQ